MSLLIDHKFLAQIAPRLSLFKRKSGKLFSFRCPFCGDSQKNKYKTRGFVYEHKSALKFKCHNCGYGCYLDRLIDKIDTEIGKAYRMEKFRERRGTSANSEFLIPKVEEDIPAEKSVEKKSGIDLGLPCLLDLPADNIAVEYALRRHLPKDRWGDLFYCENMKDLEKFNEAYKDRLPEDPRLVIPYRNRSGNITGLTGRALLASAKARYSTLRLSDEPMVYGLDRVDVTRRAFILEGQIDSMFIGNALAPGGTDFERAIGFVPREHLVLIFDNQPRNKQVVQKVEKMANKGFAISVWPKEWTYKDINDAIMDGMSLDDIMHILNSNTHSALALKLAIRDWKKL